MPFRIRWWCHYSQLTGYARAARDYLAALDRLDDVELEIACLSEGCDSPEDRYKHLDEYAIPWQDVAGRPDVEVVHAQPRLIEALISALPAPQCARLALTTWESFPLPDAYAKALSTFAAVIVPSTFCEEVVNGHESSLQAVHVVPHCFDEDFWPMPEPRAREPRAPVRFYTIGAWGERKNTAGILKAYLHEFSKADRVQLMMLVENADFDELRSLIARSGISPDDLPELYVPQHTSLSERELVGLHHESDCYVSATRGEGWGLGHFEAAIMGRRIISPLWGGQVDFLRDYGGLDEVATFPTPCFGTESRRTTDGDVARSVVSIAPGMNARQIWAEPNLSMLALWMRAYYERGDRTQYDPITERRALEARFGYKTVGPQLAQLLKGHVWAPSTSSSTS